MINRRTFGAFLAGTLAAPWASWAQPRTGAAIFYASVGPVLTLYHVDVDGIELAKQGSLTLPAKCNMLGAIPQPTFSTQRGATAVLGWPATSTVRAR